MPSFTAFLFTAGVLEYGEFWLRVAANDTQCNFHDSSLSTPIVRPPIARVGLFKLLRKFSS